jgi:hypothetical protein
MLTCVEGSHSTLSHLETDFKIAFFGNKFHICVDDIKLFNNTPLWRYVMNVAILFSFNKTQ